MRVRLEFVGVDSAADLQDVTDLLAHLGVEQEAEVSNVLSTGGAHFKVETDVSVLTFERSVAQ